MQMRDIKTLTIEEIEEFFDKIDLGDHKISDIEFDEKDEIWTVNITTEWNGSEIEGEDTIEIEDWFTFSNEEYDTNFPFSHDNLTFLYHEFLLAKGFKENRFKLV